MEFGTLREVGLMSVFYADLSHHDWDRVKGEFDWSAIRRATSSVLCLRATYGDPAGYNPITRHFADMARGATAAGFDTVGGYHNLIKSDRAGINRQVDYLRGTLDGVDATWAMLDVERYPELVTNGLWPRWDDVQQFAARWHVVDQRVLALYLPRWLWDRYLGRPDLRPLRCPLVSSDYGADPDGSPTAVYSARGGDSGRGWAAYGGVTPSMWQYGSNVDCPGASGRTDCNAYRGTLAQLRALLNGGEDDMPTADEIARAVVTYPMGSEALGVKPQPVGDWWKAAVSAYRTAVAARQDIAALRVEVTALRSVIDSLAAAIAAGGGNVDTAAILAGIDQRLTALRADKRDAVADLGEGGAAQVRGQQG